MLGCVRFVTLVLLALAACGGAPVHPKGSVAAATKAPHGPRRMAIQYSLPGHDTFALPVVHVTVGGEPTWALVDTGANTHMLAGWLARKAKITVVSMGDTGTDHTNRSIEIHRAPHPSIVVDGWGEMPDEEVLVTDVPEAIARLGIGMFLSPQQLATQATPVIFDLQERELRESSGDLDIARTTKGLTKLTAKPARACIDDESSMHGRTFVVPTSVDGLDAELLLDTGSPQTDLLQVSAPGKALLPKSQPSHQQMYAISGKVTPRTVKEASIEAGDVHRTVDLDLIPGKLDDFCPRDGVLAMDVLASCTLVIETRDVKVYCK